MYCAPDRRISIDVRTVAMAAAMLAALSLLVAAPSRAQTRAPQPPAAAQSNGNPQASTSSSTYDDWVVRCEAKPPAPKACEVVQTIAARNQQQQQSPIAEIVFGRMTKAEPVRLVIQLPPGVYLPAGASIVLDDKTPPLAAVFTRCLQTCMAEAELKPEVVQLLKSRTKAEPGRLEFEDGARRKASLPVSFKGLSAALAAREELTQ